jgi:ribosomal protein S18 acetylase RimI-like enzyme
MPRNLPSTPVDILIAPVQAQHRSAAASLAARAMADNPLHVAALGPDVRRRIEVMERAFGVLLEPRHRSLLGAWHQDRLVGMAAFASSDHCQPDPRQVSRVGPALIRAGLHAPLLLHWLLAWGRRDPATPHSHLGPVAVDPLLRGRGVGSRLLAGYVGRLDVRSETGYLETDRAENVRLYRRFGFHVVTRAAVLGTPNWFMLRIPELSPAAAPAAAAHGEPAISTCRGGTDSEFDAQRRPVAGCCRAGGGVRHGIA